MTDARTMNEWVATEQGLSWTDQLAWVRGMLGEMDVPHRAQVLELLSDPARFQQARSLYLALPPPIEPVIVQSLKLAYNSTEPATPFDSHAFARFMVAAQRSHPERFSMWCRRHAPGRAPPPPAAGLPRVPEAHEGLLAVVQRLYATSHGVPLEDVVPLVSPPGDPRALWDAFWRDLGFDATPSGSSRLMHMAMVQSLACGGPAEALLALWHVLDGAPGTRATDFFVRELNGALRSDRRLQGGRRFGEGLDTHTMSDGQVLLLGWLGSRTDDDFLDRFTAVVDALEV